MWPKIFIIQTKSATIVVKQEKKSDVRCISPYCFIMKV